MIKNENVEGEPAYDETYRRGPVVMRGNDGTWRALWSVNQHAPQFAVAYSEDLITWRPQDYPRSEERRVGKECRSRWSPYH